MSRLICTRLSIGVLAALLALPAAPVYASYTISCNSNGYRYQYCSANTNGYVRLQYQTSQAPCIRGRSWGSDNGGVWVNNGCSAQFEVGGTSGGGGSNAGAAVAAVAGLAILGAIIANHDRDDDNNGYIPPPYPGGGSPVPGWAIGTFNGALWGQRQTIQIGPDGGVNVWYRNGGSAAGWFSGNTLTVGNNAMNVQPAGGGILVNGAYFGR
jgi:Protein of unknown function (DUF3011)